jgi:ribonuclease D
VDDNQQLAQLCQQWRRAEIIALDTEFIRTDTFYPIAGLLQLSDGKGCFLIDPLAIDNWQCFADLMSDSSVIKLLHSCSEDLEVFDRLLGLLPTPIFDTQIGAAFAGYGFSLSYQNLVDEVLQIHVPKGETRSNWLQRPLTDSQLHYAALDVVYLHDVYSHLRNKLELLGRTVWWQEECLQLIEKANVYAPLSDYYKKVKSAWKLSPQQLLCLQKVTSWREQQARVKDRPRSRILKDRACFDLALQMPHSHHELSTIPDLSPGAVRKLGDTLLALVDETESAGSEAYPARLAKPLPPSAASSLKALKALVRQRAEHLDMPSELLVKKRDYESLLRSGYKTGRYSLPASLCGWRKTVIGEALLASLENA